MVTASGALIAESLRVPATIEGESFKIHKVARAECGDVSAGQPLVWTFLEFEVDVDDVEGWATRLAEVLEGGSWYCDFRSPNETFVVFAGKVFRYPRGDTEGRAAAAGYARMAGVPEAQIDWPE
jgi:hypothetical protein